MQPTDKQYGIAPRDLPFWRRPFFPHIRRPPYLKKDGADSLNRLLNTQSTLIKHGVVRLGALIQANTLLFKAGNQDHPGELLVCMDQDISPEELLAIASTAYAHKGQTEPVDPNLASLANHLGNQLTRVFGLPIAPSISRGRTAYCSTTLFRRASFPDRIVRGRLFPLLIDPTTLMAIPLPHPYWSPKSHAIYESTS